MRSRHWVFGYGSLAAATTRGYPTTLRGHRRRWGVAMDNRRTVRGYKWYRLRATGARPAAFVAFLDLRPAAGAVNGRCVPVDRATLRQLDARERNYVRVDVTALVGEARGRVWAYVGSAAARARLAAAVRRGVVLIGREYADAVERGFRALGPGELAIYRATTDRPPPGCAIAPLERIDVP